MWTEFIGSGRCRQKLSILSPLDRPPALSPRWHHALWGIGEISRVGPTEPSAAAAEQKREEPALRWMASERGCVKHSVVLGEIGRGGVARLTYTRCHRPDGHPRDIFVGAPAE